MEEDLGGVPSVLVLNLPAVPASAAIARGVLDEVLLAPKDDEARDTAALLLTELVTNAARHVGGTMRVEVAVTHNTLCVKVCDASAVLPHLANLPEWDSESGRGLFLLEALSDRWGAQELSTGKCVWFELHVRDRHAS
jgi:serine/threonine-protein kinase RsbW